MNLVHASLRRPYTVLVVVLSVVLAAILALRQMPRDILPNLGVPILYVAQPYGGMSPAQMEGYLTYYYEYHFLYLTGIEHVESKSIQGVSLVKLQFHPGTDMAQALAETINYANRAKAFMPPGTVPPFVMRFDAGSVPVGNLVFTSPSKTVGQLQDLALNRVRPLFATLPGVSAPPPFGASQRSIVIRVDPEKLKRYNLSPDDIAEAISQANTISPAGNIHLEGRYPMVPVNSVVKDIKELETIPLRLGTSPTVFLRDVGRVEDSTDLPTGFALVNGKRTVYIPVTKRADASTLAVVNLVQQNLKKFQSVLPEDVKVSYEFDQSGYVRRAIRALVSEGLLGAALTGLMVFLFLREWKSAFIVVLNIPLALLGAMVALWLTRQTVNIMTLGGLAIAVGVLVDEATVTVENIHTHLARGESLARAALDATQETILPRLLAMLCVLAVFIPSFFMKGVARALFVPLSLAVGFSMIGSYLLSSSFVPILSNWLLPHERQAEKASRFALWQGRYADCLRGLRPARWIFVILYLGATAFLLVVLTPRLGTEIFPKVDVGQFQLRLRAPTGTTIEKTEKIALEALALIQQESGNQIDVSVGFVGVQPPSYPINTIYLWTSGPEEAVLQIGLKRGSGLHIERFKERLRHLFSEKLPDVRVSFEPSDIVSRVMSQDSPTPIQIAVGGPDLAASRAFAEHLQEKLASISSLRDIQIAQSFDYPTIDVKINREKAGLMGLSVAKVGRALVAATSSSRYSAPNYWADAKSGIAYQIQVEVPQDRMTSIQAVKDVEVALNGGAIPLHRFAEVISTTTVGEYDRFNMQRMVTLTANLHGEDLGKAARHVTEVVEKLERPKGVNVAIRGQVASMKEMFAGLRMGLALAIVAIFLLLAANFQSPRLALIVLSTVPAVLAGVAVLLKITGTTLNVESFMGTIMAIGVAVANAILLITFAELHRREGNDAWEAATQGAKSRLRPILMTSCAMIVGMIPLAVGWGEGSQQTAPLGRAVIGGLAAATLATLFILPTIYAIVQGPQSIASASLDPDDPESAYHDKK
jgi:multidrug efflux pump subunit AcrB